MLKFYKDKIRDLMSCLEFTNINDILEKHILELKADGILNLYSYRRTFEGFILGSTTGFGFRKEMPKDSPFYFVHYINIEEPIIYV